MLIQLQQFSTLIGRRPLGFTEHYYNEWDDGLGKEKIAFFIVISVDSSQIPAAEIGKEAFQLLQDHFLHDLSGDPYERFEIALRELNMMVNAKEKELDFRFVPNMHIMAGVIQKDQLLISQRGDSNAYLIRKRHLSCITEGLYDAKNTEDLFQNIASGQLEVGDSLIFVTGHLSHYITAGDMSHLFSENSVADAGKKLHELLNNDLEDQIVLLAFEILEKIEEDDSSEDFLMQNTGQNKNNLFAPELPLPKSSKERLKNSLNLLQSISKHESIYRLKEKIKRLPKKQFRILLACFLLVIVGGVYGLQLSLGKQKQISNLQAKLDSVEDSIKQAQTRGAFDKDQANLLLANAESNLKDVIESGMLVSEANALLKEIKAEKDSLDNVFRVKDELSMLIDFKALIGKSKLISLAPSENGIVVFTEHESYEVLIDKAQSPKEISTKSPIIASANFPERESTVVLTSDGVIEYALSNAQLSDNSDGTWKTGIDIASYGARIYVLDAKSKQIWKYQRGTTAFGGAQAYVDAKKIEDGSVDLSDAVSIAIDGSAWILNKDGSILKLLSGAPVKYTINKAPLLKLEGANQIYTEFEMTQLYVLHAKENRIVVYNKSTKDENITYSSQYVLDDVKGTLQDFYVDKTRNVIVFITDHALYELDFTDQ